MFKEQLSFTPKSIYIDLNFEDVKEELKNKYSNLQDLGGLVITQSNDYVITINKIGKVVILYNHLPDIELYELVRQIEQSFRTTVDTFSLEKSIIN
ncbi:hypothetical protein [Neobacillus sp. YIM B06451]|uniref:hypothetical protein n=1 Tax=Neobacillus sp. YIM B06451 TaxID=3070994 RepID=UPI00292F05C1|nr:hypothetical protein [Neobacillus sp. YIM B06451]